MGAFNIGVEEFQEKFEDFLHDFEGDVSAAIVAEAFNNISEMYCWDDKLAALDKGE